MNKELTLYERYYIDTSLQNNVSIPKIAENLKRHKSTIYREIKRNSDEKKEYSPQKAHDLSVYRKKTALKHIKLTSQLKSEINSYLYDFHSPEQIAGRFRKEKKECVSFERIYQYIWEDKRQGGTLYTYLRRKTCKNKKRGNIKDNRGKILNQKSIKERPEVVEKRERAGDYEIDLVALKGRNAYLLTAVDRKTRFTKIDIVKSKDKEEVKKAIVNIFKNEALLHTLTSDNGKEFASHEEISKVLKVDYYFAEPYASCQRGTNENTNGLIRQFFPKNKYYKIDDNFVARIGLVENLLNNRPRKKLDFKTPLEVYLEELVATVAWIQVFKRAF